MSDLLAIVGSTDEDEELVEEIAARRPDRVTVLVADGDPEWGSDESVSAQLLRDRLAVLLGVIERRTGAAVVGLAGSREQLRGWRFDRVIGARDAVAA
jgi:hypothetical protein